MRVRWIQDLRRSRWKEGRHVMGTREGREVGCRSMGDRRQRRETGALETTGKWGKEEERKGGLGEANVALGPEHRGPGPRQDGTGLGQGAPSWDKSRAPVLTVHRGEGVCFAVHIHGEAEEREQRGRRRRVASQTQLQDLRRKGRDGGG